MSSAAHNRIRTVFRHLALPLLAALLLVFSGCSVVETVLDLPETNSADSAEADIVIVTDSAAAEPTNSPEPTQSPEESAPPAEDTAAQDAPAETAAPVEVVSPTTGRPLPESAVFRPALVVMDNAAQSRPQTALMLADIVYEFPLDRSDHSTRFLAIFSDNLPQRIGPVSTSRAYLADTALEWGGLYVSLGDPPSEKGDYPLLRDSGLPYYAEDYGMAANYFYRDKTISSIEEHTFFFKLLDYVTANFNTVITPAENRFAFEQGVVYEKGKSFSSVGIPFTSSDVERVVFTYDQAHNLLLRSDKNSKNVLVPSNSLTPTDDILGYQNERIAVQNLIVQYVRVTAFDSTFRSVNAVGSGDCLYFVNGRVVPGRWSRPSLSEPTTYKIYDGSLLRLEPGTTWIMMMPSLNEVKIRYTK
ncbi:MAG: DUF3048 domain-containing protein [Eubacteriales bacterium]